MLADEGFAWLDELAQSGRLQPKEKIGLLLLVAECRAWREQASGGRGDGLP
jgi:hypothetical protein